MWPTDDDARDDPSSIDWLWPGRYPTRCTNEFAEGVALDVLQGASLAAAAAKRGVAFQRVKEWLKWGNEAYNRDANETDSSAPYLNLFLKYMQAVGMAAVPVQQDIYRHNKQWWLSHHPEVRIEWGDRTTLDAASPQALLLSPALEAVVEPDVVEADPSTAPPEITMVDMRDVLKTLVATAPQPEQPQQVIDAAPPERKEDAS